MATEILAPAGSIESLKAAVRCGADAVYLGGKAFNARRNASNFSEAELAEAVEYCHARNVKVYLTLNTLVSDGEFETAYDAVRCACRMNADALILQDLGLAATVRRVCPSMPMHASTQMSVQSADGIRILEKMGFSRAVLPRELSEKEIIAISSQTDMELEYFVHGALCMCVSGQCLMSSVLGGRSGNRGLCAQPCRLPFGVNGKGGNNLSLKDLSLTDELHRLEKAGVCSFKIEGRMKRPEYVAAAVTACKNGIENKKDEEINKSLKAVFSRSGFTKGYFEGKLGGEMFGIRRKEDVEGASGVLSGLQRLYDNENPLIPVELTLTFKENEPMKLEASAFGFSTCAVSELCPEKARNKPLDRDGLSQRISKCGGTQFYADKINIDFTEGLIASAGAINGLRREALELLEKEIIRREDIPVASFEHGLKPHCGKLKTTHARFFREEQIPENLDGISRAILPIEVSTEIVERLCGLGIEAVVEIPSAVFSNGDKYVEMLEKLKKHGVSLAWVCTLDGVGIAEKAGLPFASGFGMNIYNSLSAEEIKRMGGRDCLLSCEISASEAARLSGDLPRGIMAYGRIPLMLTRNCPVKNKLTCGECGGKSVLMDRMGVKFPVVCKNGASFVLNSVPLWVGDKKNELRNIDFALLYFTDESKDECGRVITAYNNNEKAHGEFTRGLYFRKVL
ncbi:MAG: U32 family peptidase [Clostridia bacterium]|nr:U32 family peptidase [Clostridia bacterium]